ncbi:uncharacterized protein LOC110437146 isoform X2 [Sorghum bicolor]|uniref:Uncharacterized protein n=1 Tax=Sorghum bicolor TaxID=4558 RepID=A0A1Z5R9J7_SORBI|nr:uncharacterized protein LOC110437146 isoform X2 [Sorghum bicolor]OQU80442.1 hypothetical protein SORBI_3007G129100 [Sorghum bicolor]|eukprot:XP_021321134.1 uncharacterized protein LOC110437146 isoform X2 [Sorghum bicolor]
MVHGSLHGARPHGRKVSANGSEPRACSRQQPGSCCCVCCWVGLLRPPARRRVPSHADPAGSGADRLMECPADRETRQGGQAGDRTPGHAPWQRADTEEKPRVWPSDEDIIIRQLTIGLVVEGSSIRNQNSEVATMRMLHHQR